MVMDIELERGQLPWELNEKTLLIFQSPYCNRQLVVRSIQMKFYLATLQKRKDPPLHTKTKKQNYSFMEHSLKSSGLIFSII